MKILISLGDRAKGGEIKEEIKGGEGSSSSRDQTTRGGEIFEGGGRVGIIRPNSMSFAHPRFVDPFDADIVGERWLLPEY